MKVVRLIQYEGTERWLEYTLGSSLKDGKKDFGGNTITAVTVPTCRGLFHKVKLLVSILLGGSE